MTNPIRWAAYSFATSLLAVSITSVHAQTGPNTTTVDENWKGVQSAALKEAKVTLYTMVHQDVNERLKADFEKAYPGIALELVRLGGNVFVSRIEQDRKSGVDGADVVLGTYMLWLERGAVSNVFKAPSGPSTPSWPSKYMLRGIVPILSLEALVMAYNTRLVKTPITGYRDLLRPEFKGKVGTSDFIAPSVIAWYDFLDKTQGPDFLARFAEQMPRFYNGSSPNAQSVASGEIMATAFTVPAVVLPLAAQGAPIKMVVAKPSLGFSFGGAIVNSSRRPNAASLLMDYLMSPRGQTTWHGTGASASPLPGIPSSLDANAINPYDEAAYPDTVVKTLTEKWQKLFRGR